MSIINLLTVGESYLFGTGKLLFACCGEKNKGFPNMYKVLKVVNILNIF